MSSNLRMVPQGRLTIGALPLYYAGRLLKKHKAEKVRTKTETGWKKSMTRVPVNVSDFHDFFCPSAF